MISFLLFTFSPSAWDRISVSNIISIQSSSGVLTRIVATYSTICRKPKNFFFLQILTNQNHENKKGLDRNSVYGTWTRCCTYNLFVFFYIEFLTLNLGQLMLVSPLVIDRQKSPQNRFSRDADIVTLTIRAYDLGVPVMFSTINIRIYPPESKTRSVSFVLPGHNIDRKKTEDILSTITGGRVIIHDIQPYNEDHSNEGAGDDTDNGNIKIVDGATSRKDM